MKTNPFSKQTLSRLARTTILVACLAPAACKGRSAGNTTATVNALVTREPRETKFDNGQVKETFSVTKDKSGNYVKDGSYARFHQSGQKAEEGTYKADKIDGHWQEWDEQGKLTLDLHFADGRREGAYAKYRNGSPRIVGNYSQDKLSGPFKFIDDGSVITGEMARGVPEGPWTVTDASGKLRGRAQFKEGKVESVQAFATDGSVREKPDGPSCAEFEGYAIGKTRWQDVVFGEVTRDMFRGSVGENKYSKGPMFVIDGDSVTTPGVSKITLIFDTDDILTALVATAKKDDGGGYTSGFKHLHAEYSKKYTPVSSSIPFVGDCRAEYRSGGCRIMLNAPHLSFDMELVIHSAPFSAQYKAGKAAN